jgi:predicted transcriptional regulator
MINPHSACMAGQRTPTNEKTSSSRGTEGLRDFENTQPDSKQSTSGAQQTSAKAVFTQIAELALAGHAVHEIQGGAFMVCKYGMSKFCEDFDELQLFARKLGVTK